MLPSAKTLLRTIPSCAILLTLTMAAQPAKAETPLIDVSWGFGPTWTNGSLDGGMTEGSFRMDFIPNAASARIGLDGVLAASRDSNLGMSLMVMPDWPLYPGVGYRFAWSPYNSMFAGTESASGPAFSGAPEALVGLRLPLGGGIMNLEYRFMSSTFLFTIGISSQSE